MLKSDRCRPGAGLNVHAVTPYDVTANTTIVAKLAQGTANGSLTPLRRRAAAA